MARRRLSATVACRPMSLPAGQIGAHDAADTNVGSFGGEASAPVQRSCNGATPR